MVTRQRKCTDSSESPHCLSYRAEPLIGFPSEPVSVYLTGEVAAKAHRLCKGLWQQTKLAGTSELQGWRITASSVTVSISLKVLNTGKPVEVRSSNERKRFTPPQKPTRHCVSTNLSCIFCASTVRTRNSYRARPPRALLLGPRVSLLQGFTGSRGAMEERTRRRKVIQEREASTGTRYEGGLMGNPPAQRSAGQAHGRSKRVSAANVLPQSPRSTRTVHPL